MLCVSWWYFQPMAESVKKGHRSETSKHLKTGMSIPIFPMSSDLERGDGSQLTASTGYPFKKSTNSSTKQRASPKKSVDLFGANWNGLPPFSPWYHPAAKTIPNGFLVFQRPRRSTQPPLPFSEVAPKPNVLDVLWSWWHPRMHRVP